MGNTQGRHPNRMTAFFLDSEWSQTGSQSQAEQEQETRTLSVLVENRFGVLSRVAGLFSARGYNIESLTVAGSSDPSLSRITMVVRCQHNLAQQILKHVNKLMDVVTAVDLTDEN